MKRVSNHRELVSVMDLALKYTEEEMTTIVKKISMDAFSDLLRLTPRDTGYAVSNWRIGINQSDSVVLHGGSATSYSAPSFGNTNIQFGDNVHIYNNTAYIGLLEDGHSRQAPAGMIEPTAARVRIQLDRLAKAESKRKANV